MPEETKELSPEAKAAEKAKRAAAAEEELNKLRRASDAILEAERKK